MVEIALVIATVIITVITMMKQKKNAKKTEDPDVGYRYWGDAMFALAYLSHRMSVSWVNRVFRPGEESDLHVNIPYANFWGGWWNIGQHGVDSHVTTGYTRNLPAGNDLEWGDDDMFLRTNAIPVFTRGSWQNPQFPTHNLGVVCIYTNQGYMGLNTAVLSSYFGICTAVPGTIYYLMRQGAGYASPTFWVRYRNTIDLAWTVCVNPITIIADLLLDQHKYEDINWLNFAETGKRLVVKYPYMWFAMTMTQLTQESAIKDVLTKSKLSLYRDGEGLICAKIHGSSPSPDIGIFGVIDAVRDLADFAISRTSPDEAGVMNELRGTYLAARFDIESDFEKLALPVNMHDDYAAWEAANAEELKDLSLTEKLKKYPGYADETTYLEVQQNAGLHASLEGHYLSADVHAVNVGNIVHTGIRRQATHNLDFLSWPDDARHYLEEVLTRYEKPYMRATVSGTMKLEQYVVGDYVRLQVNDPSDGTVIDTVFVVEQKTVAPFDEEIVSLQMTESHEWYDVLNPGDPTDKPNVMPDVDWNSGQKPVKPPLGIYSIPMYFCTLSPAHRGVVSGVTCVSKVHPLLEVATTFLVDSCELAELDEENIVASDATNFALTCELLEPVTLKADYPCLFDRVEYNLRLLLPASADPDAVMRYVESVCQSFVGTPYQLFDGTAEKTNYVIFSTANKSNYSGVGFVTRAVGLFPYMLNKTIYIRITGLYSIEDSVDQTFSIGDIVHILAKSTTASDYGYSPIPMPANYGITTPLINNTMSLKAVVATNQNAVDWRYAHCAEYLITDHWFNKTTAVLYGVKRDGLEEISTEPLTISLSASELPLWLALPEYMKTTSNPDLLGLSQPSSSGFNLQTANNEAIIVADSTTRKTALADVEVTVSVKYGNGDVVTHTIANNKVKFSVPLRPLAKKEKLSVFATVKYNLLSDSLEVPTSLASFDTNIMEYTCV